MVKKTTKKLPKKLIKQELNEFSVRANQKEIKLDYPVFSS